MEPTASALISMRQIMKYYEQCLDVVRQCHQLSNVETIILGFLHSNPDRDTVGEIAGAWLLSKGNVSRGADTLMKRGLLERIPDPVDRRWVHLKLTPAADRILSDLEKAWDHFLQAAFAGFCPEELALFHQLRQRLSENVSRNLERSSDSHGE